MTTRSPSKEYLDWYASETTRLAEVSRRASPDIREMLRGAVESAYLCPGCLFESREDGSVRYPRQRVIGVFSPCFVDIGDGTLQATKTLTTHLVEGYGPRILFVWYKPEWSCHYCVGCGNLYPLPETLGMHAPWRGNER